MGHSGSEADGEPFGVRSVTGSLAAGVAEGAAGGSTCSLSGTDRDTVRCSSEPSVGLDEAAGLEESDGDAGETAGDGSPF